MPQQPLNPQPPDFDLASAFPELTRLRAAVSGRDWHAVASFFSSLADEEDRSFATGIAADVAGSERFLGEVAASETGSTLPAVLLARRHITLGWEIRSSRRAKYVSREQFTAFHDHLRRAERLLIDATAIEPWNAMAWRLRLITNRGLELGQREARRRYARLAEHHPHHFGAQRELLQQLCPKWSGSWDEMHGFARERMRAAPPGSLSPVLVAEGHLERWLDLGTADGKAHLRQPQVGQEIVEAARRSVLHPAFSARYGSVAAHNTFAAVFHLAGEHALAAVHFRAIGAAASELPWAYLGDKTASFTAARDAALGRG